MSRIRKQYTHGQVSIVANTCESNPIDMREYETIQVFMPDAWTPAALGVKVSPMPDTLYKPLHAQVTDYSLGPMADVVLSSVAANNAYTFDWNFMGGCGYIRLWSRDKDGNDVDQAATRVIGYALKG